MCILAWLSLEEMLSFISGDMTDCSEYISTVRGSPFQAVAMVDASFARFMIHIKVA